MEKENQYLGLLEKGRLLVTQLETDGLFNSSECVRFPVYVLDSEKEALIKESLEYLKIEVSYLSPQVKRRFANEANNLARRLEIHPDLISRKTLLDFIDSRVERKVNVIKDPDNIGAALADIASKFLFKKGIPIEYTHREFFSHFMGVIGYADRDQYDLVPDSHPSYPNHFFGVEWSHHRLHDIERLGFSPEGVSYVRKIFEATAKHLPSHYHNVRDSVTGREVGVFLNKLRVLEERVLAGVKLT